MLSKERGECTVVYASHRGSLCPKCVIALPPTDIAGLPLVFGFSQLLFKVLGLAHRLLRRVFRLIEVASQGNDLFFNKAKLLYCWCKVLFKGAVIWLSRCYILSALGFWLAHASA